MFRNVPNLRFNSFSNTYNEITIGTHIIQKGRKAKSSEWNLPAYSINNSVGFALQKDQWGDASYTKLSKEGYKYIEKGDFAYNPARINVGSIGLYKENTPCIVSSLYVCFETKPSIINDYLYIYLKSEKFNKKILRTQEGGVRTYFFYDKLEKTKMYIPSLKEQLKILKFLSLIDERIETQNKIINKYESLIKIIIDLKIYDPFSDKKALKKYASLKNGYAFKSEDYLENGRYKIITISNVTGNQYISRKANKIDIIPYDIQSHQLLRKGDILVSLTGNVGRVSMVDAENCLLNQRVGLILSKDIKLQEYLFIVLNSFNFEKSMIKKAQGAAQLNIGKSDVENYKIPCPTETKLKITNLVLKYLSRLFIEKSILEQHKKERQYLLNNLFI
ncbi:type I restriction-modification system subunit S [Mycoplasmopsis californica]|uniref:Restriction endonuclease subunit S n=1 Tax=Mycoplasmopsis equigenitalium TaxID=114883 RepID=A0ABY5J1X1_9BACT|nr:restriction endonuclease subunit S [Mycoplasmopsis equigenitalium]UUD37262.1 restriction endonuclease subunit S [Mycoplasmopsis equigenitalium]VEU69429.1 type I restriction-modification system subunit S [Mycoplasmopsis californica]